ncbi:Hint domain-containing protein [Polyangium jinanense]|uniref:Cell surface protein n=1 Tax=Polyangium jinanense TaxID=2829994 RepID=A0A9X3XB51_9BACT|nr:Hint domain-containing protein [Polyangium jinanense]MDC3962714.1 cell surface protein [Polyangium jinanense]MDC3986972.1 cell surface protein [Polyangium jinanense]
MSIQTVIRHLSALTFAVATLGAASVAQAELVLQACCAHDPLRPDEARKRLEWARACGVPNHVEVIDTALPSANGAGNLVEYIETFDLWGKNAYSGISNGNEINDTFVRNQYYNGATSQFIVNGFKKWTRTNLLPRPAYPTFGNAADVNTAKPLFPHPTLADCRLYFDKNGQHPLPVGDSFYVNAYCISTCYTPDQKVLFPDGEKPILDAMNELVPKMMTLSTGSTLESPELVPNEVYSYTRELHDGTHVIFVLKTASGGELRVTDKHPVIDGRGKVVEARSLKVGNKLIRPDGSFDPIVSVEKTLHRGKLYNIRPVTEDRVSNVLVTQGYLVGSSHYQNEDVDYMNRVLLGRAIPKVVLPGIRP